MSYLIARKVDLSPPAVAEEGFTLDEIDTSERDRNILDCNLDDEALAFAVGLIEQVDNLAEGEALVIWKEIF